MRRRRQIARHVLGDLAGRDDARVRARIERDPSAAVEAERLRDTVDRLDALEDEHWAPPAAPPLRVEPTPRADAGVAASARRRAVPRRLVLRPVVALAAAVALLLAGGMGGALLRGDEQPVRGQAVVLRALGPGPHTARARARLATGPRGTLQLTVSGLARTVGSSFYEVWLLEGPKSLVSVGTFRVGPDGTARVRFPLTADTRRFNVVDVSLEPPDGDPSHSAVSVLRSGPVRG